MIAGDAADDDAEHKAHRDAEPADGQRHPRAVNDAREEIATEPVGAQQKHLAVLGGADQMQVTLPQAPELVGIAAAQKTNRKHLAPVISIFAFQRVHVELHVTPVDEGSDIGSFVKQVEGLGRSVDEIDIAGMQIVRRQELADENREIKRGEQNARGKGDLVPLELPPHQPPLRGHVDAHMLVRHRFDRGGIEGGGGNVVRERLARRGKRRLGHLVLPPWSLMRGSSATRAKSDMRTPITVRKARNIRNEPARYMSWLCNALMSMGPVVSKDRTMAVISAPEIIAGRIEPISEMKKLSAMRRGYLMSARGGWSPLARAVVTYCFCSSSSRLARRRRIMPAVPAVPIISTGNHKCSTIDFALSQLIDSPKYF